jgi:hypothetical protein
MTASQPASLLALAERLADTQIPFLFLTAYDESFGRNGSKLAFDRADQCLSLGQFAVTIGSTASGSSCISQYFVRLAGWLAG